VYFQQQIRDHSELLLRIAQGRHAAFTGQDNLKCNCLL